MKTFVLGGVRSGKSRLAERLASESKLPVTYIATAYAGDEEMRARIKQHQNHRPAEWQLIEEPLFLTQVLAHHASAERCILIDCLTLWLSNMLMNPDELLLRTEFNAMFALLPNLPGRVILVANETNMGVIPLGELSRRYCDEAGVLHQGVAQSCEQVVLTVAGLPQVLKGDDL